MADVNKFSFIEISYKDEIKGIDAYGRLFMNENGKVVFEGNSVEESARVFFEDCLKIEIEKHIDLLIDKREHPLFYWKDK